MTIDDVLAVNPQWTYGQAAGYVAGHAAADQNDQFAGLTDDEWLHATDDYAHGYRNAVIGRLNGHSWPLYHTIMQRG